MTAPSIDMREVRDLALLLELDDRARHPHRDVRIVPDELAEPRPPAPTTPHPGDAIFSGSRVPSAAESERKGPSGRGVCGGVGLAVGIVVGVCVRSESVVCAEFRCVSSSRVWGVCDAAFV